MLCGALRTLTKRHLKRMGHSLRMQSTNESIILQFHIFCLQGSRFLLAGFETEYPEE